MAYACICHFLFVPLQSILCNKQNNHIDEHMGTPWKPYIIQLNPAEGIETVGAEGADAIRTYKILEDDHIVIIRNNEKYDVTGKKL